MYIGMSVVIEDYVHDEGLNCSASRQIGSFWPVLLSFARSRF
jgi:succinate dehydrogenase hydrophobic anchor subunit